VLLNLIGLIGGQTPVGAPGNGEANDPLKTNVAENTAMGVGAVGLAGSFGGAVARGVIGRVVVTTFTDAAGVAAIRGSGTIGTAENAAWVTLPRSVAEMGPRAVETALEIGPGRGNFSFTFGTTWSNLGVPGNGPLTSGGVPQFRLISPVPTSSAIFRINVN
jgi:hypothetical protein